MRDFDKINELNKWIRESGQNKDNRLYPVIAGQISPADDIKIVEMATEKRKVYFSSLLDPDNRKGLEDKIETEYAGLKAETKKKIVDGIVAERLAFDQFSNCDISMKEIDIIKSTIITTFTGIRHKRVSYPDVRLKGD